MTPCNYNQATPEMIKQGQVTIGDKIVLNFEEPMEDVKKTAVLMEQEKTVLATPIPVNMAHAQPPVVAKEQPTAAPSLQPSSAANTSGATSPSLSDSSSLAPSSPVSTSDYHTPVDTESCHTMATNLTEDVEEQWRLFYRDMTKYLNALENSGESGPTFTLPSSPLVPPEYSQTIDYNSLQYMNGFLRTQIGRFVKIEQLVSSNQVSDRSGFLVGVGNNYVILQEITTGNIMFFDTYSIKFIYVYYAPPVFPNI